MSRPLRCTVTVAFTLALVWIANGQDEASAQKPVSEWRAHKQKIFSLAISPDGMTVATAGDDTTSTTIKLREIAKGQDRQIWKGKVLEQVLALVFSADGKILAAAHEDRVVRLFEVSTGNELGSLTLDGITIASAITFSPDGKILAVGTVVEGTVTFWDVATKKTLASFGQNPKVLTSIAFSPNGKLLAVGGGERFKSGVIRLWDVAAKKEKAILEGFDGQVLRVAFSPNGGMLASSWEARMAHKPVRLWDPETGKQLQTLEGHIHNVFDLSFSLDGKRLLTAGKDYKVISWDGTTGKKLAEYSHQDVISAFSADSKRLATGSAVGVLRVWEIDEILSVVPKK